MTSIEGSGWISANVVMVVGSWISLGIRKDEQSGAPTPGPGAAVDSIMELSSLMLAVKRVTTLLICSMSEPCEELLRAAGSECSDGTSSSVRLAEPARWLSVLMGEGERGRAGAGKCSSASATSYSALGQASGGSEPPGAAAAQLGLPVTPGLAPAPAPPAPRPRLSVLLGKGLMTAVWLGFSFLLMWMDRRCHRCCPRPLLSFWAHVTDFPLELWREDRQR